MLVLVLGLGSRLGFLAKHTIPGWTVAHSWNCKRDGSGHAVSCTRKVRGVCVCLSVAGAHMRLELHDSLGGLEVGNRTTHQLDRLELLILEGGELVRINCAYTQLMCKPV